MKRDKYIRGAALLAGGILLAKIIGAVYRIPLTNIVGSEGIGLYQLVFPVYALLITVTSSGIPITLSRLIAEKNAVGDGLGAKAVFRQSFAFFMLMGVIAALVMVSVARFLGRIQGNEYAYIGYLLLAPAVLLSTAVAAFRGWFQGYMNMLPSAISQIAEQGVKLALGLTLAWLLAPRGIEYAVWGAIGAITVSEGAALILISIQYFLLKKKREDLRLIPPESIAGSEETVREVMKIMVPVTLGGLMLPLVQFIDSLLIVNLLKQAGDNSTNATALYGIFTGPVGSMINMPVVLTLAFAVSAVPVISSGRVHRDIDAIKLRSGMSVKLTFAIGVPSALALFALARPIMEALYPRFTPSEISVSAGLLQLTSVNIIFLSIMQIYTALLQAIDRAYTPFINMTVASAIKIILTVILITAQGIYGAAIASIIAYTVASILNIAAMVRWTGKNEILTKNVSLILLSGVIMSLALILIGKFMTGSVLLILLVGTGVGVIVYGLMLVLTNAFSRSELMAMPFSGVLIKVTDIIRFWERTDDKSNRNRTD
jgi:stage V sporulation protein B